MSVKKNLITIELQLNYANLPMAKSSITQIEFITTRVLLKKCRCGCVLHGFHGNYQNSIQKLMNNKNCNF